MKKFYASSYPFWVMSRAFLIIAGLAELWRIYTNYNNFNSRDLLVVILLIVMSIIFFGEITRSKPKMLLKYITGIFILGLGLFIVYYKFSEPEDEWTRAMNYNKFDYKKVLVYLFAIWLILLGLFDFLKFDHDSENK